MFALPLKKEDAKFILEVTNVNTIIEEEVAKIYITATTTYNTVETYVIAKIFKDYKAQGNYTYINGVEKEYKTVKPVLNAIMREFNTMHKRNEILVFTGIEKDIKETRLYKKLVAQETVIVPEVEIIEEVVEVVETPVIYKEVVNHSVIGGVEFIKMDAQEIEKVRNETITNIYYWMNTGDITIEDGTKDLQEMGLTLDVNKLNNNIKPTIIIEAPLQVSEVQPTNNTNNNKVIDSKYKYFVYAHYFNTVPDAQLYCDSVDFDYNMIERVVI